MLALAFVLFAAGVACLVWDERVNQPHRAVEQTARREQVDLERMFRLPSRVPR